MLCALSPICTVTIIPRSQTPLTPKTTLHPTSSALTSPPPCPLPLHLPPRAPETAAGNQYGPPSDLWGVGVMLYQVLTGRFPYWDCGLETLKEKPTRQVLADVGAGAVMLDTPSVCALSGEARDLLRALLERDPERRIGAHDALRHPFLKKYGHGISE